MPVMEDITTGTQGATAAGQSHLDPFDAQQQCSIPDFYKGRSIFITGATGFMGKALVEKLLRSCPEIDRLYLLMRPSKGKDVAARLKELINNPVLEALKRDRPTVLNKLVAVNGDILTPGLGLSETDLQILIEHASVVFHSAARIKFDEDLRSALESNVKGPEIVLGLCRKLKHLEAFVHVSTVYNNLDRPEIAEVVYPPMVDPEKLISIVECMDDQMLSSITKQLVGKAPNVYAYTKALGEQLLERGCKFDKIPLVIVRPSIVTAAMKEPMPGWIDNLNGPSGLVAGISKGILRVLNSNSNLIGDLVPVDIPINLMIASAWARATQKDETGGVVQVYNCSSGSLNPLTWDQFKEYGIPAVEKYPTIEMMWYPSVTFCQNALIYRIEAALFHYLPAYFMDIIIQLSGKRRFLVRLYDKAHKALACLDFYMKRQWNFVSRNPTILMKKMTEEDRRVFYFDVREINWKDYIEIYVRGARRFLLKDDPNTLPAARRNLKRLFWLRAIFRFIVIGFVLWWLFSRLVNVDRLFHRLGLTDWKSSDGMVLGHIAISQEFHKI